MIAVDLLYHLGLPSETVHEIRQYVGPHPCATMIRDLCEEIDYTGQEDLSLIEYMEWHRWWETKMRLRCLYATMRLLLDRPDGTYSLTSDPPAPWATSPPPRAQRERLSTYVGLAEVSSI